MDVQKILKVLVKIICAPIALILFGLFRIFQFFIGISGIAVTFVCLLTSVVLTIGVFVQIFAQIKGQGFGIAPIMIMAILAGALAYVPAVGVRAVLEIAETFCGWIWKLYFGSEKPFHRFYRRKEHKWADFAEELFKRGSDNEKTIYYFKGVESQDELKKRYYALLKIYHPDNNFGEDEITRNIMDEYDYLKNRLE